MSTPSEPRMVQVPPAQAGRRLDVAVAALLPDLTRSAAQRLLKEGLIEIDGRPARSSDRLAGGERLVIRPVLSRPLEAAPENIPLDIVYEDEYLLVVNKPPGMVVHPAHGHHSGTLVNALAAHCQLSAGSGEARPGIVHRLDQDTSGLLLVAKDDHLHAVLSRLVETKAVRRRYLALVWGLPEPVSGRLQTQLGRHPGHRTMMAVLPEGQGREAVTDYRVQQTYRWSWQPAADQRPQRREAALVECELHTGRTHQIRVHLQYRGCPLLGDPVYGDAVRDQGGPPELAALVGALAGQALHAARLDFTHPVTGQELALAAIPPAPWTALRQWLERQDGGG